MKEEWGKTTHKYLQVELFIPDGIQVPKYCFCSLLCLADLDCHVWVTGPRFVLGLQTLRTDHYGEKGEGSEKHITVTKQHTRQFQEQLRHLHPPLADL